MKEMANKIYFALGVKSHHWTEYILEREAYVTPDGYIYYGEMYNSKNKRIYIHKNEIHKVQPKVFYEGDLIELKHLYLIVNIREQKPDIRYYSPVKIFGALYPNLKYASIYGLITNYINRKPEERYISTNTIAKIDEISNNLQKVIDNLHQKYHIDVMKEIENVTERKEQVLSDFYLSYYFFYHENDEKVRLFLHFERDMFIAKPVEIEADNGIIKTTQVFDCEVKKFNFVIEDYKILSKEEYIPLLKGEKLEKMINAPESSKYIEFKVEVMNQKYRFFGERNFYDDSDGNTFSRILKWEIVE